jgi:hypothetical protein
MAPRSMPLRALNYKSVDLLLWAELPFLNKSSNAAKSDRKTGRRCRNFMTKLRRVTKDLLIVAKMRREK